MLRRFGVICVFVAYWAIVFACLRSASPVFMDGAGPMPSFSWTARRYPSMVQYMERTAYYDFVFLLPYATASLVVTLLGCVAVPLSRRRLQRFRGRPFWGSAIPTFTALLLLALASDVGGQLDFWSAPMFLLHGGFDPHSIIAFSKCLLSGSVLSGVVDSGWSKTVQPRVGSATPEWSITTGCCVRCASTCPQTAQSPHRWRAIPRARDCRTPRAVWRANASPSPRRRTQQRRG